jgi:hypothetical protein
LKDTRIDDLLIALLTVLSPHFRDHETYSNLITSQVVREKSNIDPSLVEDVCLGNVLAQGQGYGSYSTTRHHSPHPILEAYITNLTFNPTYLLTISSCPLLRPCRRLPRNHRRLSLQPLLLLRPPLHPANRLPNNLRLHLHRSRRRRRIHVHQSRRRSSFSLF